MVITTVVQSRDRLVSDLVSPLLDGLNSVLDDGSLSHSPDGRESVGGSLRKAKAVSDGDSGVWGGDGSSNGSSNSSGGNSGGSNGSNGTHTVSGVGKRSSAGGRVGSSESSVGVSVSQTVSSEQLRGCGLGRGTSNGKGENDKSEHGAECWLGSEELTPPC